MGTVVRLWIYFKGRAKRTCEWNVGFEVERSLGGFLDSFPRGSAKMT